MSDPTLPASQSPQLRPPHDHGHCIDAALSTAAQLCDRRGVRLTRLRRRVLELVWQDHAAVKAYDLLRELDPGTGPAKPPTVYRALEFLVGQGLVHRIESLNAFVGCPDPEGRHEACFLICERCGAVDEVAVPALRRAIAQSARDVDFEVTQQVVEVRGTCRGCRGAGA